MVRYYLITKSNILLCPLRFMINICNFAILPIFIGSIYFITKSNALLCPLRFMIIICNFAVLPIFIGSISFITKSNALLCPLRFMIFFCNFAVLPIFIGSTSLIITKTNALLYPLRFMIIICNFAVLPIFIGSTSLIFVMKVYMYNANRLVCHMNQNHSPTYDILNHAVKAGLLNTLYDIVMGTIPLISKTALSKLVWSKAWELKDLYWCSTMILNQKNDMLIRIISKIRYLSWSELSDKFPWAIKTCGTMARLICRASRLKSDDLRLKGLTPSHRTCSYCDQYVLEDLFHVVMQCPRNEVTRTTMINSITDIDGVFRTAFEENPHEVFNWLIGKDIPNISRDLLHKMWLISGKSIDKIYSQICKDRVGIG